jgi:hypothetical protein
LDNWYITNLYMFCFLRLHCRTVLPTFSYPPWRSSEHLMFTRWSTAIKCFIHKGLEFNSWNRIWRNTFASNSHNEDIPCAMCRSTSTTTTMMIPGRQTCYNGWKKEYRGFIASGHVGHSASNYICIDSNPEYIPLGKASIDGHLMYMVGIKWGPLPCQPYDNNRKLNCVVCSK